MTRQSSIERAAQLEGKTGLVCIGRFFVDGEAVDFPYAEDDLSRDADFWSGVLRGYGIDRGRRTLVSALAWELPWSQSVRVGTNRAGGTYANAEFWGWDARRFDLFLRRTQPHAVVGLGREMVDSLGNLVEDVAARLSAVPVLLVRPEAVESLRNVGVNPAGVVGPIGPAVAVSLPDGSGLAVDEREWTVYDEDGELLITTIGPRAATFARQRTGVRGHVERTTIGTRIVLEQ